MKYQLIFMYYYSLYTVYAGYLARSQPEVSENFVDNFQLVSCGILGLNLF